MMNNQEIARDCRIYLSANRVGLIAVIAVLVDLLLTLLGNLISPIIGGAIFSFEASVFSSVMLGMLYQVIVFDRKNLGIFAYFSDFRLFWLLTKIAFLQSVFILLWTILLIIPGIVKAYAYMQAVPKAIDDYENGRDMQSAMNYIRWSRDRMKGYKGQLFMLLLPCYGLIFVISIVIFIAVQFITHLNLADMVNEGTTFSILAPTLISAIPCLIVVPTIMVRQVVFAKDLIQNQEHINVS